MLQNLAQFQAWKQWGWMQYSVLALAIFLTINSVYKRHNQRIEPVTSVNIETMEEDIQEFNTMAEQLGQLEKLPHVAKQWAYAKAVTANLDVEIMPVYNKKEAYRGPLAAWNGVLSGNTGQVLAAAKKIQETVPTYLYGYNVDGNESRITFSVLGSE